LVPLLTPRPALALLRDRVDLLVMLLGFAVLGWIGGTDTERILFWSAPIVLVLIGTSLSAAAWRAPYLVALFAVAQAFAMRLWWPTPPQIAVGERIDLVVLAPQGVALRYEDLLSWMMAPSVRAAVLAQYAVLAVALGVLVLLRTRPRLGLATLRAALGRRTPRAADASADLSARQENDRAC
jgi:hypothetical protein